MSVLHKSLLLAVQPNWLNLGGIDAFTAPVSSFEGETSLYNMQTVDGDRLLCVRKFA